MILKKLINKNLQQIFINKILYFIALLGLFTILFKLLINLASMFVNISYFQYSFIVYIFYSLIPVAIIIFSLSFKNLKIYKKVDVKNILETYFQSNSEETKEILFEEFTLYKNLYNKNLEKIKKPEYKVFIFSAIASSLVKTAPPSP